MTKRECAIIMAYTGVATLCGENLKYFYEYVNEISNNKYGFDLGVAFHSEEIMSLSKKDFIELCSNAK